MLLIYKIGVIVVNRILLLKQKKETTQLENMAVAGSLDNESGLFSNSSNVSSSTSTNSTGYTGWTEFCERHARASASDFAKSCIHYVNKNLPENVRATVSHRDFMMKFIECFSDHFDTEFSRRRVQKVSMFFKKKSIIYCSLRSSQYSIHSFIHSCGCSVAHYKNLI